MTQKLYMENPYLRELEADVLDKKFRNNKYYIRLNRTIFYPDLAGGQPGDKGTINGIEVEKSYEENGEIIHILNENFTGNKIKMVIDWENRLDLMQQHTGQHLLSSSIYRLFSGETIGFHLGRDYVYIDLTLDKLSQDDIEKIEILANKIICSNFDIKSYFVDDVQLSKIPVRKPSTVNSQIRIVEIDSIDYSPCGGTHLKNTGEIGMIKIRKWEKYKEGIRVEFVSGNRALKDYSWKNEYINKMSIFLSAKDKEVLSKFEKYIQDKENLERENRDLKESLATIKANELLSEAKDLGNYRVIFKELENTGFKEISFLSAFLNNNNERLVQIYGLVNESNGQFHVSKTKDLEIDLQTIYKFVATKFNVKGGGNPGTIQGGSELKDLTNILNLFYHEITKKD